MKTSSENHRQPSKTHFTRFFAKRASVFAMVIIAGLMVLTSCAAITMARSEHDPRPGYADKLRRLHRQVFAEARQTERVFDMHEISSLEISPCLHHTINIVHGGDRVIVRYYEWVDGHYSLTISDGALVLEETIPYRDWDGWHSGRGLVGTTWHTSFLFISPSHGRRHSQPIHPLEVVIPEHMVLGGLVINGQAGQVNLPSYLKVDGDFIVSTTNRDLDIRGVQVGGNAQLGTNNADIFIFGSSFANGLTASTVNAPITIQASVLNGTTSLETRNARISIAESIFDNIYVNAESGNVNIYLLGHIEDYDVYFSGSERGSLSFNGINIANHALRNVEALSRISFSTERGSFAVHGSQLGNFESGEPREPSENETSNITPPERRSDSIESHEYHFVPGRNPSSRRTSNFITVDWDRDFYVTLDADMNALTDMVFNEPRRVEREFDGITALNILTISDRVVVTVGGDRLLIRYFEWLDGHYSITVDNGLLTMDEAFPHSYPVLWRQGQNHGFIGTWLQLYLDYRVMHSNEPRWEGIIEIVIPQSMMIDELMVQTVADYAHISAAAREAMGHIASIRLPLRSELLQSRRVPR